MLEIECKLFYNCRGRWSLAVEFLELNRSLIEINREGLASLGLLDEIDDRLLITSLCSFIDLVDLKILPDAISDEDDREDDPCRENDLTDAAVFEKFAFELHALKFSLKFRVRIFLIGFDSDECANRTRKRTFHDE